MNRDEIKSELTTIIDEIDVSLIIARGAAYDAQRAFIEFEDAITAARNGERELQHCIDWIGKMIAIIPK